MTAPPLRILAVLASPAGLGELNLERGSAPAAIAMQSEISDSAGIDLARTFYTALATGRPVDAALTQARVTLAMNSSVEWATPVLFSRAPDNRLFDIRGVLPTPDCSYPGMKPFTEQQQEFFFGRDKEIDNAVKRQIVTGLHSAISPPSHQSPVTNHQLSSSSISCPLSTINLPGHKR